jgi:hypothetical protein
MLTFLYCVRKFAFYGREELRLEQGQFVRPCSDILGCSNQRCGDLVNRVAVTFPCGLADLFAFVMAVF